MQPMIMRLAPVALFAAAACTDHAAPLDLADPPSAVAVASGDAQVGAAGSELPSPLAVRVTDAAGRPVPAVKVTWSAERGTIALVNDSTDDQGLSSVRLTLPTQSGTDRVTAVVDGVGSALFTVTAQPVPGTIVFRYIDAGSYHSCGITTQETLLCWGYGADGQLGLSTTTPEQFPSLIPGDLRYRLVSGGRFHSCGLTLAGIGYCWGNNGDGRLGTGGELSSPTPAPVLVDSGGPTVAFQAIQAGRVHSCAIDLSQHAWCWGYNGEGELGNGSITPGSGSQFAGLAAATNLKAIGLGALHTCAITGGGGGLCWGYNASGQLGDGSNTTSGTPQTVSGGLTFVTDPLVIFPSPEPDFPLPPGPFLAAGYDHTCAIATDTETYCWGLNQDGQLGDGGVTSHNAPTAVSGAQAFVAVTAGQRHTCGLTAAGAAFCWGGNTHGQLGDASVIRRLTPTAVAGGLTFAYLKAGDLSTCGVTSAGVAYCWGDNQYSQLGDGTSVSSTSPVKVAFQP